MWSLSLHLVFWHSLQYLEYWKLSRFFSNNSLKLFFSSSVALIHDGIVLDAFGAVVLEQRPLISNIQKIGQWSERFCVRCNTPASVILLPNSLFQWKWSKTRCNKASWTERHSIHRWNWQGCFQIKCWRCRCIKRGCSERSFAVSRGINSQH